ncbi:MAG: hypothetical protein ACREAS_08295 [Nitrososphaera sp.]
MIRKIALGAGFLSIIAITLGMPSAFAQPQPPEPCFDPTGLNSIIAFLESSEITGAADAAQNLREVREDITEVIPFCPT